ncbi:hypothetical protein [Nocardia asteroides]|uniref:hypothetical protein n=1 Tax=Nocardia asteroides TaxID=1824 RepID=UPI00343BBE40
MPVMGDPYPGREVLANPCAVLPSRHDISPRCGTIDLPGALAPDTADTGVTAMREPLKRLPATMCQLDGCPYPKHSSTVLGVPLCQQHQRMYQARQTLGEPLKLGSPEQKYSRDGYPLV